MVDGASYQNLRDLNLLDKIVLHDSDMQGAMQ